MLIAPLSTSCRILLVSTDQDIHRMMEAVLMGPDSHSQVQKGTAGAVGPGNRLSGFGSWCEVDSFSAGCDALCEGMQIGQPFSLVVLDGYEGSENGLRSMMEQIWSVDSALRVVLCLPVIQQVRISVFPDEKLGQWVILRKPCFEEDVWLLCSCLCDRPLNQLSMINGEETGIGVQSDSTLDRHEDSVLQAKEAELEYAREELATSKFFVDNILRSMADSLFVITMDMAIGSVNRSLLNLLGYEEDELLGESPGRIFGEAFAQGAIMEALMMQGSVSGVESSFLSKDGREIPISVSGSLIKDEGGQFQGMVCVAQDITERKRMEEEKRQLHEQLLDTSRQLGMAEVASGVLHNVGNVLNSVNVSVGILGDVVQHTLVGDVQRISQLFDKHQDDLGAFVSENPKGKQIPGYLRRLSSQLLDEKHRMLAELDRIKDNVSRAQQCVAAQQDLAKPNHITEPFWLEDLIEEALVLNEDALKQGRIQVVREFHELPQVMFDRHQILQVAVSLIRNACQAMDSVPERRLTVRIKQIPGPPDSVRLEVKDSGRGIHSEDLTRIFGQGYSGKGEGRGTSLHNGALVAKNFGGALIARSDGLGQGATLVLDLPGQFHFPDL